MTHTFSFNKIALTICLTGLLGGLLAQVADAGVATRTTAVTRYGTVSRTTVAGPGYRPPPPPHWDNDPYWNHPVATAAAVGIVAGTAAAVTQAALGSTVYALPTTGCVSTITAGLTYFHCGTIWYQPRYVSSGVSYVVVTGPG